MVLVMIVILGLAAGMAGSTWKTIMQREREAELLFRGDQYRRALESYFRQGHGNVSSGPVVTGTPGRIGSGPGGGNYPAALEDLVRDPRSATVVRHLRKLYPDPFTGENFVLIKDPAGRIKGVKSASTLTPFKEDGFAKEYIDFKGAASYGGWQFVYEPGRNRSQNTTGGTTIQGLPGRNPAGQMQLSNPFPAIPGDGNPSQ